MRTPKIVLRKPTLTRDMTRWVAIGVPVALAAIVGLMSVSTAVHARFDWVPVTHPNIVVESILKLILALVLIAVAVGITFPLSLAVHMTGHAVAGHLFGMRLLAVRLGPFPRDSPGNRQPV